MEPSLLTSFNSSWSKETSMTSVVCTSSCISNISNNSWLFTYTYTYLHIRIHLLYTRLESVCLSVCLSLSLSLSLSISLSVRLPLSHGTAVSTMEHRISCTSASSVHFECSKPRVVGSRLQLLDCCHDCALMVFLRHLNQLSRLRRIPKHFQWH